MKVIVYNQQFGSETHMKLIIPNLECGLTLEQIAAKDVPAGLEYMIVEESSLPDPTFAKAWELTIENPDGSGVGPDAWFIEKYQKDLDAWNSQFAPSREESIDMTDEQYDQAVAQFNAIKQANIDELTKMIANHQLEMSQ